MIPVLCKLVLRLPAPILAVLALVLASDPRASAEAEAVSWSNSSIASSLALGSSRPASPAVSGDSCLSSGMEANPSRPEQIMLGVAHAVRSGIPPLSKGSRLARLLGR